MPVDVSVLTGCEATTAVDNFNYSSSPISAHDGSWTDSVVTGHGAMDTDGAAANNSSSSSSGTFSGYKNNSGPWGPNFVVMATVTSLGDSRDGGIYLYILEGSGLGSGTPDGYIGEWRLRVASTDEFRIKRLDAGVETTLSSGTFQEATVGDKWALVRNSNDLEIWWKTGSSWTFMATVSSSTYTANKRLGLNINLAAAGASASLDDLKANNIVAAPSVDLTGVFMMA